MRKIKDILRLRHEAGLAYRGVANALNIGYGTVVDYLNRAEQAGLAWPIPEGMDERDLGRLLLGNRFLWTSVKRSRLLPFGGGIDDEKLAPLAYELRQVFTIAHDQHVITMDDDAQDLWRSIYEELSTGGYGLIGSMTARMEAQMVRVASIYAVLDKSHTITPTHLQAAKAVIDYCDRSVRHIFSSATGNSIADSILKSLQTEPGLSRTAIGLMGAGHWKKHAIDEAIDILVDDYGVLEVDISTKGRPKKYLTLDKAAGSHIQMVTDEPIDNAR